MKSTFEREDPPDRDGRIASDERFRAIANQLPIMIWQQNRWGGVVFTNQSWHNVTGLPMEPAYRSAEAWRRVVHPADFDRIIAVVSSAINSRSAYQFEFRLKAADQDEDSYRWCIASAIPDYDRGIFRGWTGYSADVHVFYGDNLMFKSLFNANVVGIFVVKLSGRIVTANDYLLRTIGYSRDDLVNGLIDWRKLTPPEWEDADAQAIEHLEKHGVAQQFEKEYYRKDGSRVPILLGVSALPGQPDIVLCYAVDLSFVKRVESQIADVSDRAAESERQFQAVLDSVPAITWTARADGYIDWYNAQWYEYTGLTPEDSAGWGWQSAHHPDDFVEVMKAWPESIATGRPFEMEFRLRAASGQYRWFLTRIRPLKDAAGAVVRWYGSNVDIQAQRELLGRAQRISESLQRAFLPKTLPRTERIRFDASYVPAEKDAYVGGDWYEAAQLPNGKYFVAVGDVAGHGLDASIVAGSMRQTGLGLAIAYDNVVDILQSLNHVLKSQYPDVYATALVGLIDLACGTITYASAGHPLPLLSIDRGRSVVSLPGGGIPLGLQDELFLKAHTRELAPDSALLFYTDGLIEFSRDIDAAEAALLAAFRRVAAAPTAAPAARIKADVIGDHQTPDDVAILAVHIADFSLDAPVIDTVTTEKDWRFHSSDAASAQRARRELMAFLNRFTSDEALYAAELVLGEVLANTVVHAPGLVEVHIDWNGERPIVTVRDTGPGIADVNSDLPSEITSENGRGLFLLYRLATDVEIEKLPVFGTQLRFVLPLRRSSDVLS